MASSRGVPSPRRSAGPGAQLPRTHTRLCTSHSGDNKSQGSQRQEPRAVRDTGRAAGDSQGVQARQLPQGLGGDPSQLVVLQHPVRRGRGLRTPAHGAGGPPEPPTSHTLPSAPASGPEGPGPAPGPAVGFRSSAGTVAWAQARPEGGGAAQGFLGGGADEDDGEVHGCGHWARSPNSRFCGSSAGRVWGQAGFPPWPRFPCLHG